MALSPTLTEAIEMAEAAATPPLWTPTHVRGISQVVDTGPAYGEPSPLAILGMEHWLQMLGIDALLGSAAPRGDVVDFMVSGDFADGGSVDETVDVFALLAAPECSVIPGATALPHEAVTLPFTTVEQSVEGVLSGACHHISIRERD